MTQADPNARIMKALETLMATSSFSHSLDTTATKDEEEPNAHFREEPQRG